MQWFIDANKEYIRLLKRSASATWMWEFVVLSVNSINQLKGSVKEPNISIYFFRPSLNGVLFPMLCLLVEGECQILVF